MGISEQTRASMLRAGFLCILGGVAGAGCGLTAPVKSEPPRVCPEVDAAASCAAAEARCGALDVADACREETITVQCGACDVLRVCGADHQCAPRPLPMRRVVAPGREPGTGWTSFSESVAIWGDWALIGAPYGFRDDRYGGDAFTLTLDDASSAPTPAPMPQLEEVARFGDAVALGPGVMAIGASELDGRRGRVFLYAQEAGSGAWTQSWTLFAPEGASRNFGRSVLLSDDGETLLVSTRGEASPANTRGQVFIYHATPLAAEPWTLQQTLSPMRDTSDVYPDFGAAMHMREGLLVISAPRDGTRGDFAGALYVYTREASGAWSQVQVIYPPALGTPKVLGSAVVVGEGFIAASMPSFERGDALRGIVDIFERAEGGAGPWMHAVRLAPENVKASKGFGGALAWLDAGVLAVGAGNADLDTLDPDALSEGAVYLYARGADGSWGVPVRVVDTDPQADAAFGRRLASDGARLLIGAPGSGDLAAHPGSAHLLDLASTP